MDPVKNILEYEPKLFGEEDRTESEYSYPGFGKSFLDILAEERKAEQARNNKENDLIGAKDYQNLLEAENSKNKFADYYTHKQWLSDSSALRMGVSQEKLDEIKATAGTKDGRNVLTAMFDNGIANTSAAITGGLDILFGKPLQALGWENNPISTVNNFYQNRKNQKYDEMIKESKETGYGKPMEHAVKFGSGLVSAVPNLLIAYMSSGTSLAAQSGSALSNILNNPAFWYSFETSLYPEYQNAKMNGATENEATLVAPIASLFNAGIEVGGGIEKLPKVMQNGGMRNKILSNWTKVAIEEGNESVLQDMASELTQKVIFDHGKDWISFDKNNNAVLNVPKSFENWVNSAAIGGVLSMPLVTGTIVIKDGKYVPGFVESERYNQKIDRIDSLSPDGYIEIGTINEGSVLNKVGLDDGKLYMDVSKINKSIKDHGALETKIIMKGLPNILNDPTVITESDYENTICIFSESYFNNSPIMVGVVVILNRDGTATVNKVRTIHARRDHSTNINSKNILYLNPKKERTHSWFQAMGTDVPSGGTSPGFIRSLTRRGKIVNVKKTEEKIKVK